PLYRRCDEVQSGGILAGLYRRNADKLHCEASSRLPVIRRRVEAVSGNDQTDDPVLQPQSDRPFPRALHESEYEPLCQRAATRRLAGRLRPDAVELDPDASLQQGGRFRRRRDVLARRHKPTSSCEIHHDFRNDWSSGVWTESHLFATGYAGHDESMADL